MIGKALNLFTTLLIDNGKFFNLKEHVDKLKFDYFDSFGKKWLFNENDLASFLSHQKLEKRSYRLNIFASNPPSFKITAYDKPLAEKMSLKVYSKPFYSDFAHLKKTDFSERLSLKNEAQEQGYVDYIFTDENGFILETTIDNIFWINGKTLFTPSKKLPLYFGVTLQQIIYAAINLGYQIEEVFEKDIQKLAMSQLFTCNSLKEICPISLVDDQVCAHSIDVVEKLISAYEIERQSSLLPSLLNSHAKY